MPLSAPPVLLVSTSSIPPPLMLVGDVASMRLFESPGAPALKPLLFVPLGVLVAVSGVAAATIEATLPVTPFAVMLAPHVLLFVPASPTFIDQPAGGDVPAAPMESKFSVNAPRNGAALAETAFSPKA